MARSQISLFILLILISQTTPAKTAKTTKTAATKEPTVAAAIDRKQKLFLPMIDANDGSGVCSTLEPVKIEWKYTAVCSKGADKLEIKKMEHAFGPAALARDFKHVSASSAEPQFKHETFAWGELNSVCVQTPNANCYYYLKLHKTGAILGMRGIQAIQIDFKKIHVGVN